MRDIFLKNPFILNNILHQKSTYREEVTARQKFCSEKLAILRRSCNYWKKIASLSKDVELRQDKPRYDLQNRMYWHSDFIDKLFPLLLRGKKHKIPEPKMKLNKIDTSLPVQVL